MIGVHVDIFGSYNGAVASDHLAESESTQHPETQKVFEKGTLSKTTISFPSLNGVECFHYATD